MAQQRGSRAEVAAKWRERISRWRRQQCSITEFCRREGISQPSFFQWRKRLESEATRRNESTVAPRGAAFIPVQVIAPAAAPARREHEATATGAPTWLEISCGELVCRLPTQVEESTLRRVVRVLCEEAARC